MVMIGSLIQIHKSIFALILESVILDAKSKTSKLPLTIILSQAHLTLQIMVNFSLPKKSNPSLVTMIGDYKMNDGIGASLKDSQETLGTALTCNLFSFNQLLLTKNF